MADLERNPALAADVSIEIVADKDAPGNDYARLNGVPLQTCRARCLEDGRCAAFTYNQRRKVCFLKDRKDPALTDFRGATTGLKRTQAVAAPAPPETSPEPPPPTAEDAEAPPPPDRSDRSEEREVREAPVIPPDPVIRTARTTEGCTLFDGDFALTRNPRIVLTFEPLGEGAETDKARMAFTDQGKDVLSGRLRLEADRFAFVEDGDGAAPRSVTILDSANPSGTAVNDPVFVVVGGLPFEGGVFRRVACRPR